MGNLLGLKRLNVSMANVVVRSAQSLSLAEKRILIAGVAKLRGTNELVTLSAQEYAETYDVALILLTLS